MRRPKRSFKYVALFVSILTALVLLALVLHPRGQASLRITPGFRPLAEDGRVYFEPGGEVFATQVAGLLPGSIKAVEVAQSQPLLPGFRVYVTASHLRFAQLMAIPPDSPVRGFAFPHDIWVSPLALDFRGQDTLGASITHELSHLHLLQHLGWLGKTRHLPTWFVEGLADWVADTGFEIITRKKAIEALKNGYSFVPDDTGKLPLPRDSLVYGISWPMMHAQSRLFIEFLYAYDGDAFRLFIEAVLGKVHFHAAFRQAFGVDLESAWRAFLANPETQTGLSPL